MKGGILKFKDNIVDHLRKGLMSWLFGALAEGGVELPDTFDVKGIIKLLASIFGLTWANIRNRLVKQIGEKAMAAAEKGVSIFQTIASEGVAGLWHMLIDKLGDIKEMILAAGPRLRDHQDHHRRYHVADQPAQPGRGVHQSLQADLRRRHVLRRQRRPDRQVRQHRHRLRRRHRPRQHRRSRGQDRRRTRPDGPDHHRVPGRHHRPRTASAQKIRQIIETLQKPINKALDFVIKTGLKLAGPIIRGLKGISGKVKAKVAAGKAWVKGKAEQPSSSEVKEKAARKLSALFARPVEGPESVKSTVDSVYAELKTEGLKSIEVEPKAPGVFDVFVAASNRKRATSFWLEPLVLLYGKDLRVRWSLKGKRVTGVPHTALVAKWNGEQLYRRTSGEESPHGEQKESPHAEQQLIAYIMANRRVLSPPRPGKHDVLEVLLTKSPCTQCGEQLRAFAVSNRIELNLVVTGLYSPQKIGGKEEARETLFQLIGSGVDVRVPSMDEVLSAYGGPTRQAI